MNGASLDGAPDLVAFDLLVHPYAAVAGDWINGCRSTYLVTASVPIRHVLARSGKWKAVWTAVRDGTEGSPGELLVPRCNYK